MLSPDYPFKAAVVIFSPFGHKRNMAVAQKTGVPKWLALESGNMDQNLRKKPSDRLILSHTHIPVVLSIDFPLATATFRGSFGFSGLLSTPRSSPHK